MRLENSKMHKIVVLLGVEGWKGLANHDYYYDLK